MKNVILIYSGGMDSTVALYHLLEQGYGVRCLSINYNQRHNKELNYAQAMCLKLGVEWQFADLTNISPLLAGSALTSDDVQVPEGHYAAESMKATVVPNRNMIMLSVAIGWAVSVKAEYVCYAAHAGDHTIYPDCRKEFAAAIDTCALLCDWHQVELMRPFISKSKTEIAELGEFLKVPFEETWSCYKGGEKHCGVCGTCVERIEALAEAGVTDLTEYCDE